MAPSSGGDRGLRPTCAFERWMKKELRALAQIGEADLIPLWGRRHGEQSLKQIVQRAFVKDERTGRDVTSWCAETNFGKLGAGRRSRRLWLHLNMQKQIFMSRHVFSHGLANFHDCKLWSSAWVSGPPFGAVCPCEPAGWQQADCEAWVKTAGQIGDLRETLLSFGPPCAELPYDSHDEVNSPTVAQVAAAFLHETTEPAVGAIGGLDDPSERDCCLLQRLLSRFGLPEGSQQTTLNEEAQPSAGRVVQDAAPADADFSAVGLSQVGLDSCGVSRDRTREPENKTRCRAKRKIKTHWAEKFRARGHKIRSPTKSRTGSSEPPCPLASPRGCHGVATTTRVRDEVCDDGAPCLLQGPSSASQDSSSAKQVSPPSPLGFCSSGFLGQGDLPEEWAWAHHQTIFRRCMHLEPWSVAYHAVHVDIAASSLWAQVAKTDCADTQVQAWKVTEPQTQSDGHGLIQHETLLQPGPVPCDLVQHEPFPCESVQHEPFPCMVPQEPFPCNQVQHEPFPCKLVRHELSPCMVPQEPCPCNQVQHELSQDPLAQHEPSPCPLVQHEPHPYRVPQEFSLCNHAQSWVQLPFCSLWSSAGTRGLPLEAVPLCCDHRAATSPPLRPLGFRAPGSLGGCRARSGCLRLLSEVAQSLCCGLCPGQSRNNDPYVGQRIGEAAHPGPAAENDCADAQAQVWEMTEPQTQSEGHGLMMPELLLQPGPVSYALEQHEPFSCESVQHELSPCSLPQEPSPGHQVWHKPFQRDLVQHEPFPCMVPQKPFPCHPVRHEPFPCELVQHEPFPCMVPQDPLVQHEPSPYPLVQHEPYPYRVRQDFSLCNIAQNCVKSFFCSLWSSAWIRDLPLEAVLSCCDRRVATSPSLRPLGFRAPGFFGGCRARNGCLRLLSEVAHSLCCGMCPGRSRNHDPYVGQRIGEAAHPGPAPRRENALLAGLDLEQLLLPLLKRLIKQALEDLLQDGLVPGRPAKAEEEAPARRVVLSPETPSQSNSNGRGAHHTTVTPPAPKPPKVGKGKGATAAASQEQTWTVVTRRSKDSAEAFQLRAQDWDAPVLSFSGLGATIEKAGQGQTIKGVLLASKDECTTALRMLKSAGKPFAVLFASLGKGSNSQRIPGRVGDVLRFRDAFVEQHASDAGLTQPAPKDVRSAPKIKQLQTSLIYVRIPQAFAPEQTWRDFKSDAERASMKWSSSQHVQGIDSFGWVEEQLRNAPGRQLFGIMRVPSADVGNLLGVSGQRGIFVEPAKRDLHRFRSEWIPRLSKQESHDHYMQRALRGAPAMGLAVFGQRIAWRHNLKEGEVLPRVWTIDGLPSTVTAQDMLPVLEQGFQEVTLMSHRRKKGLLSVRFRAVCTAGDRDLVPLRVSIDQGDPVCFWATLAPARSVEAKQKPLGKKAVPFVSAAQQTSLDPKPNPAAGAEAQQVDDEGKPIPNAKRTRGATREIPTGLQREECLKDGNCAFTSMAAALNWIQQKSGDDAYNHLELRARVATHIAKHSDQYKSEWDQKLPDGSTGKTWDDYLQATAQAGSFASELELRAIGRVFDVRILILPASDCFQPMVFHTSQKKRLAVLWLQDKHLEFLKPSCEKSSCKDYPAEFWQVTDGPVRGIRAGGKTVSARASAAGSVGTVFTCDAASRAGTVWTKAPKTNPKDVASDRGSLKVESAVTRPDGARRNRGPRSRGTAACSQTAASRSANASVFTGKRSAQGDCISKQCTLAEGSGAGVLGDADDDSQDLSGCEPARTIQTSEHEPLQASPCRCHVAWKVASPEGW